MSTLLDFLFGCTHSNVSRPIRGYQVCLTCGAERPYRFGEKPRNNWTKTHAQPRSTDGTVKVYGYSTH